MEKRERRGEVKEEKGRNQNRRWEWWQMEMKEGRKEDGKGGGRKLINGENRNGKEEEKM